MRQEGSRGFTGLTESEARLRADSDSHNSIRLFRHCRAMIRG